MRITYVPPSRAVLLSLLRRRPRPRHHHHHRRRRRDHWSKRPMGSQVQRRPAPGWQQVQPMPERKQE
jgi:hypothetical protein